MKIVIVGGRNKARYLLKTFVRRKHTVVFVNRDRDFCRTMAREFDIDRAVVGDASRPSVINDARIQGFDLIISLCPSDADNIVICRLARAVGVKRSVSVVNNPANIPAFGKLGIDTTVSIASIISLVIERNAFTDSIESLLPIEDGKALLMEVEVEPNFAIIGKQIMDARLPADCLITCIMRDGQAIIARGNTVIEVGDRLVLIALPHAKQRLIKAITIED